MAFEDEWTQQEVAPAEWQSAQRRLNQLPADGGGGPQPPLLGGASPDLATAPEKKKEAAASIETRIEPGTTTGANAADLVDVQATGILGCRNDPMASNSVVRPYSSASEAAVAG